MTSGWRSAPAATRLLLACLLVVSFAHPRHVTFAEVEFSPERGVLEVALQIEVRALERELSRLDSSAQVVRADGSSDAALVRYLGRHFLVWRREDELGRPRPSGPAPRPQERTGGPAGLGVTPRPLSRLERTPITWIGLEIEGRHAWLYFEVPLSGGLDGARFSNRILLGHEPRQVNTLLISRGKLRATLHCTRSRPKAILKERNLVAPPKIPAHDDQRK